MTEVKHWSVVQMGGAADLTVEVLVGLDPGDASLEEALGSVLGFANPVAIDIGDGSKSVRLTVEQVDRNGDVLEKRQAYVAYDESGDIAQGMARASRLIR